MISNMSWIIMLLSWVFWLAVIGVIIWALVKAFRKTKAEELEENEFDSDLQSEEKKGEIIK